MLPPAVFAIESTSARRAAQVLENRAGIPLSLALVYLEVAQRCEFPMLGLNLPGHFMLTPKVLPPVQFRSDAFLFASLDTCA